MLVMLFLGWACGAAWAEWQSAGWVLAVAGLRVFYCRTSIWLVKLLSSGWAGLACLWSSCVLAVMPYVCCLSPDAHVSCSRSSLRRLFCCSAAVSVASTSTCVLAVA